MKKLIAPILLFAAVFCVSAICQKYSLVQQESLGLFLLTPDYLKMVFSSPLPLSHLAGGFLVQFFKYDSLGPAVLAALLTLAYLLLRGTLNRCFQGSSLVPMLPAVAAWWLIARDPDPSGACALVLFAAAARLLSLLLPRLKKQLFVKWDIPAAVAVLAVGVTLICMDGDVRTREEMSKVELYSVNCQWDKVLETATPQWTQAHHDMLPFALLALNERGELSEKMFTYPVRGDGDLDSEGLNNRIAYTFTALLYERLGCANEAVHNVFQGAVYLRYGSSFRTLRQLVQYNYLLGDYALVRKYLDILERSTAHSAFVVRYEELMASGSPRALPAVNESFSAAVLDHDQMVDLALLVNEGISSPIVTDRYLCYLLLRCDLETFESGFEKVKSYYKTLPRHFREALALTHPDISVAGNNLYLEYISSRAGR